MKNQIEIERRLVKLRNRHKKKYVEKHTSKTPENCKYNYLHHLNTLKYSSDDNETIEVNIQPDKDIRICTFGSDKPEKWNGDICDSVEVSGKCPFFCPRTNEESLSEEFDTLIQDDEYTIDNYSDVAALQWVLNVRVHSVKHRNFIIYYLMWIYQIIIQKVFRR